MRTETWNYNGYFGASRDVVLTPGVLDEDARDVFCRGHCHSLALALWELLPDSELTAVWIDGTPDHVCVALPGGDLLDAKGVWTEDDMDERYGGVDYIGWIDEEAIAELEETGFYRRARVEDAMPFARALLRREGLNDPACALAA